MLKNKFKKYQETKMMSEILRFGMKKDESICLQQRKSTPIYISAIYTGIIVLSLSHWGLRFSFCKNLKTKENIESSC